MRQVRPQERFASFIGRKIFLKKDGIDYGYYLISASNALFFDKYGKPNGENPSIVNGWTLDALFNFNYLWTWFCQDDLLEKYKQRLLQE